MRVMTDYSIEPNSNLYISIVSNDKVMRDWAKIISFFVMVYALAIVYVIFRWPYTPEDAIKDMKTVGPIGFVFDFVFIYLMYKWFRKKKKSSD